MERSRLILAFSGPFALCLLLAGCPVDDRSLTGLRVSIIGGAPGDDGGEGGDLGQAGAGDSGGGGAESGGSGNAGSTSGSSGSAGASLGGTAGSSGNGGSGLAPEGGSAGSSVVEPCPDLDRNLVADCEETIARNPAFDVDVESWSSETGLELSWSESDARDKDDSGALAVENQTVDSQSGTTMIGARQCFSVLGGAAVSVAAEVSVLDESAQAQGGFQLIPYQGPSCAGMALAPVSSNLVNGSEWSVAERTYITTLATRSVAVRLIALKPFSDPPVQVLFDNVLVKTL
jgi:hypothetical protein